jgi:UDP-N-acetylmuramoyl-L-alanyl-D-glutamate--2,6-diaminopimelate ligase
VEGTGDGVMLSRLLSRARLRRPLAEGDALIRGIASTSAEVRAGSLFVALRGTDRDGHEFVGEAVRRGAAAVVAERSLPGLEVPVVRVRDGRLALARLAAAWHGHPATRLRMVGITGTLGKTSVLAMLEAAMRTAGRPTGSIGSLGIRVGDDFRQTGHTVPGPLVVQSALRELVDRGYENAAMEVTSHALDQERVHGILFDLGIFTNLVPLEHAEYHGTFSDYVRVKRRFFEHLRPQAPLLFDWADRAVRALVREEAVLGIGCGVSRRARVRSSIGRVTPEGTELMLEIRRPFEVFGASVGPLRLPLELRLLGRSNLANAVLAASGALCLGAPPEAVAEALRSIPPARRRMQVFRAGRITILDDTTGHPDSISAVFEVAERLDPPGVHVVFCVRGQRGTRINRRLGEALAIWGERVDLRTLTVTTSADAADERNEVTAGERAAFVGALNRMAVRFREEPEMERAVRYAVGAARPGDLVLLMGAQGMDRAGEVARALLGGEPARAG